GFAGLLRFHLAPDNRLLIGDSRQRVDQTDLGLLISNISHSLRDGKRGPASIAEEDGTVWIRVLAADHFRSDVVTLYRFFIDKGSWLPAKVEESTADGYPEKTITFGGLEINTGIAESFFRLD
ncbi:MAG: hypothetical protein L7F78_11560, partial [Syntrophales bacterium LBB04]|nr:hypothetical protein [Syntrophales bacterium LBB04]